MLLNTDSICKASSRDGTMIMACVLVLAGFNNFVNGNKYANVLPDPVADNKSTLLCSAMASIEASCISLSDLIFNFDKTLPVRVFLMGIKAKVS